MHPGDFERSIVFEDRHLLAATKPTGIPSQGDQSRDTDFRSIALQYLQSRSGSKAFCGLIHRLDRPTSGLMVFAKSPKSLQKMNALFKDREVTKEYLCLSENKATHPFGMLEHHLYKDKKLNKTFVKKESGQSKFASLTYEYLGDSHEDHLYLIRPLTGRSHQIRVQMAYIGCPLVGDRKYGGKRLEDSSLFGLHAFSLRFVHPIEGSDMKLTSLPPANSLWNSALEICKNL